ncbi:MAG: sensor histidine kinase [Flavobacteriales bacterium]|nr:sensor histidine kinase [Flavobacteriales bacterium]
MAAQAFKGATAMGDRTLSWKIWPAAAALLAVLFIAWDVSLVGDARRVQQRIGRQLALISELNALAADLDQFTFAARNSTEDLPQRWARGRQEILTRTDDITRRHGTQPGVKELGPMVRTLVTDLDSLHREVLVRQADPAAQRMAEAVLGILVKNGQKRIDGMVRQVQENGLGASTAALSSHWDQAQTLLILACLMALIFALLVGMNRRLLNESRAQAGELQGAKERMEHINRELRETMLSKEEKEVMIKEIHHRVKNNLQIVRSLIRFQLEQVQDARVQELFQECVNRVGAMALVHEQTYLSKDLANINVRTYFDSLVRDLVSAYNIRLKLRMDVDIRVETLGVDTLVPLGLLINEVISNSFKHAFKGRDQGTIIVHLSGSEFEGLHLRIGDDGVGLPDRNKWSRPNSLGMELIHTLAGQLDMKMELLPGGGTIFQASSQPVQRQRRA